MKRSRSEAGVSLEVSVDQFNCPICLDLLKDPVATPCGHSFCKECINGCWNQRGRQRCFSCPQCRKSFRPKPDLCRNAILAEMVEKLKESKVQAAPPAQCYTEPGDVECHFCTEIKHKAIKSCLKCMSSFCEAHLKPHLERPALKKHTLVEPCRDLQEKICSKHDKPMEIYCRTDGSSICDLCTMEEHRGHDTVTAKAERTKKERDLKEEQRKSQQRIQHKQKKAEELKQALEDIKSRCQAAEQQSDQIFLEMIGYMEKRRSEVTLLIKNQEEAEVDKADDFQQKVEQEISDLQRRVTEMEALLQTQDHTHFLLSFASLQSSPVSSDSESITVHPKISFKKVMKSLSSLKKRLEEFCDEEFSKERFRGISLQAAADQLIPFVEPSSRAEFLQYFRKLTLDPNTVNEFIILSENNSAAQHNHNPESYPDHPERFAFSKQVLCKERVTGRCYWEVDVNLVVDIAVSYKDITRTGRDAKSAFGKNPQSWALLCYYSPSCACLFFKHFTEEFSVPRCSRVGVYVDYRAGTLSFYSVSDTMKLLHRVHTTFTQPLYAGFNVQYGSVKLCNPENTINE